MFTASAIAEELGILLDRELRTIAPTKAMSFPSMRVLNRRQEQVADRAPVDSPRETARDLVPNGERSWCWKNESVRFDANWSRQSIAIHGSHNGLELDVRRVRASASSGSSTCSKSIWRLR